MKNYFFFCTTKWIFFFSINLFTLGISYIILCLLITKAKRNNKYRLYVYSRSKSKHHLVLIKAVYPFIFLSLSLPRVLFSFVIGKINENFFDCRGWVELVVLLESTLVFWKFIDLLKEIAKFYEKIFHFFFFLNLEVEGWLQQNHSKLILSEFSAWEIFEKSQNNQIFHIKLPTPCMYKKTHITSRLAVAQHGILHSTQKSPSRNGFLMKIMICKKYRIKNQFSVESFFSLLLFQPVGRNVDRLYSFFLLYKHWGRWLVGLI